MCLDGHSGFRAAAWVASPLPEAGCAGLCSLHRWTSTGWIVSWGTDSDTQGPRRDSSNSATDSDTANSFFSNPDLGKPEQWRWQEGLLLPLYWSPCWIHGLQIPFRGDLWHQGTFCSKLKCSQPNFYMSSHIGFTMTSSERNSRARSSRVLGEPVQGKFVLPQIISTTLVLQMTRFCIKCPISKTTVSMATLSWTSPVQRPVGRWTILTSLWFNGTERSSISESFADAQIAGPQWIQNAQIDGIWRSMAKFWHIALELTLGWRWLAGSSGSMASGVQPMARPKHRLPMSRLYCLWMVFAKPSWTETTLRRRRWIGIADMHDVVRTLEAQEFGWTNDSLDTRQCYDLPTCFLMCQMLRLHLTDGILRQGDLDAMLIFVMWIQRRKMRKASGRKQFLAQLINWFLKLTFRVFHCTPVHASGLAVMLVKLIMLRRITRNISLNALRPTSALRGFGTTIFPTSMKNWKLTIQLAMPCAKRFGDQEQWRMKLNPDTWANSGRNPRVMDPHHHCWRQPMASANSWPLLMGQRVAGASKC